MMKFATRNFQSRVLMCKFAIAFTWEGQCVGPGSGQHAHSFPGHMPLCPGTAHSALGSLGVRQALCLYERLWFLSFHFTFKSLNDPRAWGVLPS